MTHQKFSKILCTVFAAAALAGCGGEPLEDRAHRALDNEGHTNITFKKNMFAVLKCAEDDDFGLDFSATNAKGKQVDGTVCMGLVKGATIRHR